MVPMNPTLRELMNDPNSATGRVAAAMSTELEGVISTIQQSAGVMTPDVLFEMLRQAPHMHKRAVIEMCRAMADDLERLLMESPPS